VLLVVLVVVVTVVELMLEQQTRAAVVVVLLAVLVIQQAAQVEVVLSSCVTQIHLQLLSVQVLQVQNRLLRAALSVPRLLLVREM
jgi:hypothetical protein